AASQEGSLLKVGGHRIELTPRIENQAQQEGRWIIAMRVHVALDGQELPALRTGSVGVDTTRDAALQTAADEWSRQFGTAVVEALGPGGRKRAPIAAGAYQLFPGPAGIRGTDEPGRFDASLKELSEAIAGFVATCFPPGPNPAW